MVVWSSLAEARRCLNGESSCKYEVLLSFEDRELPYQDSYSELKGAWAASRLRGFINISDRSELPRHMQKWHWSWVKVGLAREVSDWSGVSYMSDPAHPPSGALQKSAGNVKVRLPEPNAWHEQNRLQRLVGVLGDQ